MQKFVIATIGSRTERDGIVVEATPKEEGSYVGPHKIACVGDLVRYPDGIESVIVSGAGDVSMIGNRPVALVGSHIANGDHIVSSLQTAAELSFDDDEALPQGLLQPALAQTDSVRRA
jgi:uncharacterized Zn-binding protein involved in type VI secretion